MEELIIGGWTRFEDALALATRRVEQAKHSVCVVYVPHPDSENDGMTARKIIVKV